VWCTVTFKPTTIDSLVDGLDVSVLNEVIQIADRPVQDSGVQAPVPRYLPVQGNLDHRQGDCIPGSRGRGGGAGDGRIALPTQNLACG